MGNFTNKHNQFISKLLSEVDNKGYLRHRESSTIEFKENFHFEKIAKYAKTMSAFANNKGGYIIFGIKDSPRLLKGINKKNFDRLRLEKITNFLLEHFEPEINWDIGLIELNEKSFGYIYTYESDEKPVICKKNSGNGELKSGEIYYRYRAQTRKIEYPELKKIIEEYRERERQMWIKHIENIAKIGPTNVALVDLFTGEINTTRLHNARLVIDEKLLEDVRDKIKFVEEGRFSEKEGEPTLKIIGKVEIANVILDPNQYYPYLVKNIADELNITQYEAQALIWKHKLKGNKKYHIKIQSGKSIIHKYSKHTIDFLKKELEKLSEDTLQDFLKNLRKEYYNSSIKTKRRKRHNR